MIKTLVLSPFLEKKIDLHAINIIETRPFNVERQRYPANCLPGPWNLELVAMVVGSVSDRPPAPPPLLLVVSVHLASSKASELEMDD